MDIATLSRDLGMLLLGALLDQLFWRYRRGMERADAAAELSARDAQISRLQADRQ